MNSIKKNFIYNSLYQILILITPLITVPYVSRILKVEGVGIYSYTYSIVNYFMIITLLGINNYGNRTIAQTRDNKKEMSKKFFEIYSIQVIVGITMLIIYLSYLLIFESKYRIISTIQTIYIISAIFDINWFFFGIEKFKITVTRSTILKILSLICIFIFVKDKNDLWIYTLILSLSTLISQLLLIPFLKKEVMFYKPKIKDIRKHIKPCLILFIPVIAISLYKIMDKIMLGSLITVKEVGYYEQAEKIINIPMGLVTALGTVMLPRISNLAYKKDNTKILDYIEKTMYFMMFLAFPICFGLISISKDFVPIFMGEEFKKTAILVNLLSITLIFLSYANVIRKLWLVPKEKDKVFTISVILGAVINLIINFLLIPKYHSIGACIGTILAEFTVMIYQIFYVYKDIPLKKYCKKQLIFLLTSIIMFIIILFFNFLDINIILKVILKVGFGIGIYLLLNYKYVLSLVKK